MHVLTYATRVISVGGCAWLCAITGTHAGGNGSALQRYALDKDWLNSWMDYLPRLDAEAQALFANGVRSPKYSKQSMVMTNKKFTEWAMQNSHLYTADKV